MKTFTLVVITLVFAGAAQAQRNWLEPAVQMGLAAADYGVTQAGHNIGIPEGNPPFLCGGRICPGRYWSANGFLVAGNYWANRSLIPKLGRRPRLAVRILQWSGIAIRAYLLVRNVRILERRSNH